MPDNATVMDLDVVITETNAISVPDPIKVALVRDLAPIATRLALYGQKAETVTVNSEQDANVAAEVCDQISEDMKTVKNHDVLSKITDGLHKLHRRWTGLRDEFLVPLEANRKTIKGKILTWQEAERQKAETEQRRLQAEADEKARRQQEALLKKAESMKTPEKQEQYREQAQAVIAPTVIIAAPKAAIRATRRWKVKSVDPQTFIRAAAQDVNMQGYIEIKTTMLERGKAANPGLQLPGVVFEQQLV